jgi:hypothetical protein
MTLKQLLRGLKWFALLFALAVLLLLAAWLASNWSDAAPQPRSAALAVPAPKIDDQSNAFFALVGLFSQEDRKDVHTIGKVAWTIRAAFAARPLAERTNPAYQEMLVQERAALGEVLQGLKGPPALCDPNHSDCTTAWLAALDALSEQRQQHAHLGRRCEELVGERFEFEERLPPFNSSADSIAPHIGGASSCSQWLLSGAVLAWGRNDKARALVLLKQADRLHRGLLAGSQSLVSQAVSWALARNGLRVFAELGLRDDLLLQPVAEFAAPWPEQREAARRWIVVEAAFQQAVASEVLAQCESKTAMPMHDNEDEDDSVLVRWISAWLCRHRIALHPERSKQSLDAHWLGLLQSLEAGLPVAAAQMQRETQARDSHGVLGLLTWRNTFGNAILEVSRSAYDDYFARQADLDLHREAIGLAVAAQLAQVPSTERASWTKLQALSASARDRLSWNAAGTILDGQTWSMAHTAYEHQHRRFSIRVVWPAVQKP